MCFLFPEGWDGVARAAQRMLDHLWIKEATGVCFFISLLENFVGVLYIFNEF